MSSFSEQIESLKNAAVQALSSAEELSALEQARVTYLGANSEFNGLLKQLGKLPKEERPIVGIVVNLAKT